MESFQLVLIPTSSILLLLWFVADFKKFLQFKKSFKEHFDFVGSKVICDFNINFVSATIFFNELFPILLLFQICKQRLHP